MPPITPAVKDVIAVGASPEGVLATGKRLMFVAALPPFK
jgi:hypothetical protein